jgi:hypothetical protein
MQYNRMRDVPEYSGPTLEPTIDLEVERRR